MKKSMYHSMHVLVTEGLLIHVLLIPSFILYKTIHRFPISFHYPLPASFE